jgi:hypothetical protein
MYFDGALNLEGVGAVLLISPQGEQLKYVLQSTTRPPTTVQSTKH